MGRESLATGSLAHFASQSVASLPDSPLEDSGGQSCQSSFAFVGAASVYPFVWNLLLAAREEDLGGVLTTMVIREEPEVLEALGAGPGSAVAALVALGHPVKTYSKLTRAPVASFTTVDRVDGPPFG